MQPIKGSLQPIGMRSRINETFHLPLGRVKKTLWPLSVRTELENPGDPIPKRLDQIAVKMG